MSDMLYRHNKHWYYLLIAPALALYLFALIIPLLFGTIPSAFYNWNIVKGVHKFNGLTNFSRMFGDATFLQSLKFTAELALFSVVGTNILAFAVAFLLDANLLGKSVSRALFFIPNIMSGILVAFVWLYILTGAVPDVGKRLGIPFLQEISWFGSTGMAAFSVILVSVWQGMGYLMMLYIAGLQTIPRDVIEAAELDGCTGIRKVFRIQLPLIMPTLTISLFISISGAFKAMDVPLALTGGGPGRATQTLAMTIYNEAFETHKLGYASAEAVVLLLIVLLITVIQLRVTRSREVQM
ncbi:MAG: sugar ABC transporter permease [Eubacteriales bacterium]|nr:sugar ABC transporter permease [Eubacteriales bacterium]